MEGPWATVGVLTQKSKPKEAKGGRMFSVWTLADLSGVLWYACNAEFGLFANLHQELSAKMLFWSLSRLLCKALQNIERVMMR